MKKYGNHICLLDATHKTTKYAIPLFFIVVKTNVDYQVVGSFAVQDEKADSITEALQIFKIWNPNWNPKCFMVDNSDAEIGSIEQLFLETYILLCQFHREQSWDRWLNATANGMRSLKDVALVFLRRMANAETEKEYESSVEALKESPLWNLTSSKKFRDYVEKTWLPVHKKWVTAYRKGLMEIIVNTNNGIERKNRDFKYEFLRQFKDKSLSGMLTVLVEQFGPETYERYCEENIRRSSLYRSYNTHLPAWFHNRPKKIVDHLVQKMELAQDISIITRTSDSSFFVKKSSNSTEYLVSLGSDDSYPSCQCPSWKREMLPCKHMMAIFQKVPGVGWSSLPDAYKNSPYFKLDDDIVSASKKNDIPTDVATDEDVQKLKFQDIPSKLFPKRSKASECRELLGELRSLTFLVDDDDALEDLEENLLCLVEKISIAAPKEDGIILEAQKPRRAINTSYKQELPIPKSRKSNLTGRVGIGSENKKKHSYINIPENEEVDLEWGIEEWEPVPRYTLFNEAGINITDYHQHQQPATEDSPPDVPVPPGYGYDELEDNVTSEHAAPAEIHPALPEKYTSVIDLEDPAPPAKNMVPQKTVSKLKKHKRVKHLSSPGLSLKEERIIHNGEWLSDSSINLAQTLLQHKFPNIEGLQDTVLGQSFNFSIVPSDKPYIQILHSEKRKHWVCVANIDPGKTDDTHFIYDSLSPAKGVQPYDIISQVASYSRCPEDCLFLKGLSVQQQNNGSDCGFFAIAFATSLCYGADPQVISYDKPRMREHLLSCMKNGNITPFPTTVQRVTRCSKNLQSIPLLCSCRLPNKVNVPMADCDSCKKWYHRKCEKIPAIVFTKKNVPWKCKQCL